MANQLGPIAIECDAPSYLIVQACERLDFQSPLDVRWRRMVHFLNESPIGARVWNFFFMKNSVDKKPCSCGRPLPVLEDYAFTFAGGKVLNFSLGQCPYCRTIYWEKDITADSGLYGSSES